MFDVKIEGADAILARFVAMSDRVKQLRQDAPQLAEAFAEPSSDEETVAELSITGRGATTAQLIGNISRGVDLHPSLIRLAAKFIVSGRSEGWTIAMLRKLMDASNAPHDARWAKRYADIPRDVFSARRFTVKPKRRRRRRRKVEVSGSVFVPQETKVGVTDAVGDQLVDMAREAMKWQ